MSQNLSLQTERLSPDYERDPPLQPVKESAPGKPARAEPLTGERIAELKDKIVAALHTVFDPEIPVNIYELGLVYEIQIEPAGQVLIKMTLTSPGCPVAGTLPGEVERKIEALADVVSAKVELVWEPPWTMERMSDAAKLQLGIDDW